MTTKSEDLGKVATAIQNIVDSVPHPPNMRVNFRGMVLGMQQSFRSFRDRVQPFVSSVVPHFWWPNSARS